MGIEFEVRVEGHSLYTGSPFKGQYGDVESVGIGNQRRRIDGFISRGSMEMLRA